ncbi:hypothetical protein KSX_48140 [Ktedonospora formicarum]|uniref:DUF2795 domain-containing protein n=2 Tax=Ktedonospora formicarum TaxID=2778364 RepID=A0A8J3I303_9CHLR|nr:hypothetical protein KSX_48140 [Ktedonospora formicarum]
MEHHTRLEKFLEGTEYPTTKANLVIYAERYGIEHQISQRLLQLPERKFDTPTEVLSALGLVRSTSAKDSVESHRGSSNYDRNIPQGGKGGHS